MSATIFVLCLLSSLLSTVAPLKCQSCFATKEECRNEDMEMVECSSDQGHCLTFSFQSSMITPTTIFTAKRCAKTEECSQGYYQITSTVDRYHQMKVACCVNDGCNTAPLPLPQRSDLKPNGLICPGSYDQNGQSGGIEPVICLGEEDQCINVHFSMVALAAFSESVAVKGCSTSNVCAYPKGESQEANGLIKYNIKTLECQHAQGLKALQGLTMNDMLDWLN